MLTGIQQVHFGAADLERAVAFYRDVLGMRVCHRSPEWASLEFFGARIGLQGPGPLPGRPHPRPTGAGPVLTLRSTDLDADLAYLRRSGVAVEAPTEHPFGRLAVFHDSEGNRLMLMQPLAVAPAAAATKDPA